MRERIRIGAAAVAWFLLLPIAAVTAEQPAPGLYLSYGIGPGAQNPDLEPRYYDDKFFGAILAGGVGFNTEWQDKNAFADAKEACYRLASHWLFQYRGSNMISHPSYSGGHTVNVSGFAASSFEMVELNPLVRATDHFLAGKNVALDEATSVDLIAGLRRQVNSATYNITRINQITSPVSVSQAEISIDAATLGQANGLYFGGMLRHTVSKEIEISAGLFLYDLHGTAELDYMTVKGSSAGAAVALRHEDGLWRVTGFELTFGGKYTIAPTWRLLASFHRENATVQDSQVINYNFSSDTSPGSSNSVLGFLLTYPGSAQRESVTRITIGIEKQFDL